jgi:hypothetical protein
MTKIEKAQNIQRYISNFKQELKTEIKGNKITFINDLVAYFSESEDYRLILSFLANSSRLSYYPSEKTMTKGLIRAIKEYTNFTIYRKPEHFVSIEKVR